MIQVEDWMLIAGLLAVFLFLIIYLIYIRITRKLFPKQIEFENEIQPNKAITIATIEGSGIIKQIEMKTNENDKSLISVTVNQTSFLTFGLNQKNSRLSKNLDSLEESLSFEVNLNKHFERNVTIFFNNNSDKLSHSNGKIYYEIKKPLRVTLRTLLSELYH